MKNYLFIILLSTVLISCATKKAPVNASQSFMIPADLSQIIYEGGDGKTIDNAVIIKNAQNIINGIAAEYAYIAKSHGEKFKDWKPLRQALTFKDEKKFDVIYIELTSNDEKLTYYFDITDFFGKY